MKGISIETLDSRFAAEIASAPGGKNIRKCYACGTCTAGCPVFQVDADYNPRKLIRMILLGMRKEVLSSKAIWLCARCYTCTANCPQSVDFSDIMTVLRDMAVAEGYAPADTLQKIEAISAAAHELRRDCINLLLGAEGASAQGIRARVDKVLGLVDGARES